MITDLIYGFVAWSKTSLLKCKKCGCLHTGSMSARVCPQCYGKGHR